MKRRRFKLVLFLILGAMVNIAVAWGIAVLTSIERPVLPSLPTAQQIQWWTDHAPVGYLKVPSSSKKPKFEDIGSSNTMMAATEPHSRSDYWTNSLHLRRVGWPARSVEGARWSKHVGHEIILYEAALPLPSWTGLATSDWKWLPLRPIWPGFAINTIIYMSILSMLWTGPFVIRRVIRSIRGNCIKCGYDLRGIDHNKCPECGWGREGTEVNAITK